MYDQLIFDLTLEFLAYLESALIFYWFQNIYLNPKYSLELGKINEISQKETRLFALHFHKTKNTRETNK